MLSSFAKRFCILLMITMLPLHSMVASAMGVQMVLNTTHSVASNAIDAWTTELNDAEDAHDAKAGIPCHDTVEVGSDAVGTNCYSCSACHTAALPVAANVNNAPVTVHEEPHAAPMADTGIHARSLAKPPKF